MNRTLVKMQFGSHVYGTNTPTSDTDYKAVYVPSAPDIILQRVQNTIVQSTKALKTARNEPGDVDLETFSLQQYLKLLMEGQTIAIDMLFTPESFYQTDPSWEWQEIQANRAKFAHRGYSAFAGYCRQQANKYGIKGSRIAAVRKLLEALSNLPRESKLLENKAEFIKFAAETEHVAIVQCRAPNGRLEDHLEVCNRKMPFHAKVKFITEVFQKIFDEYGSRALQAEKCEGVDWKALGHAVRICNQSREYLTTGNIIFPRPERKVLLQIRTGQLPYAQVATMIEEGLLLMEEAAKTSALPLEPDRAYAEELVLRSYGAAVR